MATGETVTAIAMTEPGTGSDLQAVRTTAVLDGDEYVINGSKIFITNGYLCDMAIVVCKTGIAIKDLPIYHSLLSKLTVLVLLRANHLTKLV